MAKQKFLLLLRQYQEEMLEAYLIESPISPTYFTIAISYTTAYPIFS